MLAIKGSKYRMFPIRCSEILPLILFMARWTIIGTARKATRPSMVRYKECNYDENALILALIASLLATRARAETVDIKLADADTLAEVIVGVGPTLATTIVDCRAAFGVFESVYELVIFKGIVAALIGNNRDSITVDRGLDSDC